MHTDLTTILMSYIKLITCSTVRYVGTNIQLINVLRYIHLHTTFNSCICRRVTLYMMSKYFDGPETDVMNDR